MKSGPYQNQKNSSGGADGEAQELFNRVTAEMDRLAGLLNVNNNSTSSPEAGRNKVEAQIRVVRSLAEEAVRELEGTRGQMSQLACAQADAIVRSAEIIDELETTKRKLADARKRAEDAARDTMRLADTVFESTQDAVLIIRDGECFACNDRATSILGDRSEILNRWPTALHSAEYEDGTNAEQSLRRACYEAVAEKHSMVEVSLPRGNGEILWCEISVAPFTMKGNGHVLMAIHDITARKLYEKELQRNRDFLNNILNAIPDQLAVRSSDQKLVLTNEAYLSTFGDEQAETDQDRFKGPIPSGSQESDEFEIESKEGERKTYSTRYSSFLDSVSGTRYTVSASRDITGERQRERRLELLANVFRNAAEGVAILTREGDIVEANPMYVRMSGRPLTEILGRKFTESLGSKLPEIEQVLASVTKEKPWSGKLTLKKGLEEERSFWTSVSVSGNQDDGRELLIAAFSDVTALERTQQQLEYQAYYDQVTGLPNRRFFRKHLEELVESSEGRESFAVCFLDLDDFKQINDTLGHSAGDQFLIFVASSLSRVVGPEAFVSRFGGDEFAMILPDCDAGCRKVLKIAEEIQTIFRDPIRLGTNELSAGVSIGVTLYPEHTTDAERLLRYADIAMYRAKQSGKNSTYVFNPQMQESVSHRNRIQRELRQALQVGDIQLYYQPKISSLTGQLMGCEALSRWWRADGSYVSPAEFVPIAEQTGLIAPLGDYVLQKAAEQCRRFVDAGLEPFPVAVNISSQHLHRSDFMDRLMSIIKDAGALPEWFELELTEHAVVEDIGHAKSVLQRLKQLGFRTAIDDFGTGYSSLSYIQSMPIHTLKIDTSFVRNLGTSRNSVAITRAIVALGNGLGLTVVGEGVEEPEQARCLRDLGCEVLQGYLISEPLCAKEFVDWVKDGQHSERYQLRLNRKAGMEMQPLFS